MANIHEEFNSTILAQAFPLLSGFDSYKIVDGNIVFFKKENCDICKCNLEGANPITFVHTKKPYTFWSVDDVLSANHLRRWTYCETVGELEPIEETGGYGCYDCKTKINQVAQ